MTHDGSFSNSVSQNMRHFHPENRMADKFCLPNLDSSKNKFTVINSIVLTSGITVYLNNIEFIKINAKVENTLLFT